MRSAIPLLTLLALLCSLTSCESGTAVPPSSTVYVPSAPDYNAAQMWYVDRQDRGEGVDIFYIPSTWEFDWKTSDSLLSHYADPSLPLHREHMATEMKQVAAYMAPGNNFYSPHYRHITLNSWATLNEDTISRRFHDVAFRDVQSAFAHFLRAYNQGRPFILAGFSQGGKSVVELLKRLSVDERHRLVAAYVLGYKVTPDDIKQAPWIRPALDSLDTGVTICYNTVSSVRHIKPVVSSPTVMCINPVNWRTDATPARLHDTLTVAVDTLHRVLVLHGFDGSRLPNILDVLNVGDYHGVEPWLYSESLGRNIRQRIRSYRAAHP